LKIIYIILAQFLHSFEQFCLCGYGNKNSKWICVYSTVIHLFWLQYWAFTFLKNHEMTWLAEWRPVSLSQNHSATFS
jgi:hypothetical protein